LGAYPFVERPWTKRKERKKKKSERRKGTVAG
jgi:hypothetical protein